MKMAMIPAFFLAVFCSPVPAQQTTPLAPAHPISADQTREIYTLTGVRALMHSMAH